MSDLLKLLFDLGELGHKFSHSFGDLPDPNPGLGLEARRVSKEPGNRATKSLGYGIQAIKNRKAFACLILAYGSIGDFEHFGQHRDGHSSGVSGLFEFFAKYFCCIHGSFYHDLISLDDEIKVHYPRTSGSRKWLKKVKSRAGLTNQSLGEKCGVSVRQVANWISGSGVSREGQQALARVLGPEVLLGFFLESLEKYLKENNGYEKV